MIYESLRGCLSKPHIAINRAHYPNEKMSNNTHNFTFSLQISHSWRFGAGDTYLPTSIRTDAVPYKKIQVIWAYLACAFTMFMYQPCTVPRMNYTQYSLSYARYDQSKNRNTNRISVKWRSIRLHYVSDRYFIDRNKSHYRLICHSNKRDICTCIYKNASLLKSYMAMYMVTTKIMLNGIAIIKTRYFSNFIYLFDFQLRTCKNGTL